MYLIGVDKLICMMKLIAPQIIIFYDQSRAYAWSGKKNCSYSESSSPHSNTCERKRVWLWHFMHAFGLIPFCRLCLEEHPSMLDSTHCMPNLFMILTLHATIFCLLAILMHRCKEHGASIIFVTPMIFSLYKWSIIAWKNSSSVQLLSLVFSNIDHCSWEFSWYDQFICLSWNNVD